MKILLSLSALFLASTLHAGERHQHREHAAHVHGSAELAMAFEGTQGKIDFKSPSESIFGFEHVAKTAEDKKTLDDALKKIEKNIDQMIRFDQTLKCQFSKEKIDVIFEEKKHSSTVAIFNVKCEKPVLGSKLTFNIQKFFPRLKEIDVQIILDNFQKSLKLKSDGNSLELK